MVGQHFVFHPFIRLEKFGNGGDGLFCIVKTGNNRRARKYGHIGNSSARMRKFSRIRLLDRPVCASCTALSMCRHAHVVEVWRCFADNVGRYQAAGLYCGLNAPGASLAQQGHGKFALEQRFAARKGQPAAGAHKRPCPAQPLAAHHPQYALCHKPANPERGRPPRRACGTRRSRCGLCSACRLRPA